MNKEVTPKKFYTPLKVIVAICVVIGLILLGIPTINTIKKIGREEAYEKRVKMIEKAALKWADDNETVEPIIITVNKLINEKYIEADDLEGNLLNPRDEEYSYNCHTIFIEYKSGEHIVKYNEENDCELMKLETYNINLVAKTMSGTIIKSRELTNEDIVLSVVVDIEYKSIAWYEDGELIANSEYDESIIIKTDSELNKMYSVRIETDDGIANLEFRANIKKEISANQLNS